MVAPSAPTNLTTDDTIGDRFAVSFTDTEGDDKDGYRLYLKPTSESQLSQDVAEGEALDVRDTTITTGRNEALADSIDIQWTITAELRPDYSDEANAAFLRLGGADLTLQQRGRRNGLVWAGASGRVGAADTDGLVPHHVALTFDGGTHRAYIDGQRAGSKQGLTSLLRDFDGTVDVHNCWLTELQLFARRLSGPAVDSDAHSVDQPDPVFRVPVTEGNGDTAADTVGGHDLEVGDADWVSAEMAASTGDRPPRWAVQTDGMYSPEGPDGMEPDAVTVAVSFRIDGSFENWDSLVGYNWPNPGAFNLFVDQAGTLSWKVTDGSGSRPLIASTTLNTDTEYTAVATVDYSSGDGALWINGVLEGGSTGKSVDVVDPTAHRVQTSPASDTISMGRLTCWPRVLTDTEIATVFDPAAQNPCNSFIDWRFNDPTATNTVEDQSNTLFDSDGTFRGTPTYTAPLTQVGYTTSHLTEGEQYDVRAATFNSDGETLDQ